MPVEVSSFDFSVFILQFCQIIRKALDFCGLEEAYHLEILSHWFGRMFWKTSNHRFLDIVWISRLLHVPKMRGLIGGVVSHFIGINKNSSI